jgi:hypothetical protein
MASFWDKLNQGIKEGVQTVSEKTEQLTKIGRIKLSILATKRDLEKKFIELGGRVYQLINEEKGTRIANDKQLKTLAEDIKVLENKLNSLEKDLEQSKV